jgi:hypothetical protein
MRSGKARLARSNAGSWEQAPSGRRKARSCVVVSYFPSALSASSARLERLFQSGRRDGLGPPFSRIADTATVLTVLLVRCSSTAAHPILKSGSSRKASARKVRRIYAGFFWIDCFLKNAASSYRRMMVAIRSSDAKPSSRLFCAGRIAPMKQRRLQAWLRVMFVLYSLRKMMSVYRPSKKDSSL